MTHGFLGRRKRLALILTTALVSLGVTAGTTSAATTTFTNSASITIPDSGVATPYPSTINVSGLAGNVQKATVKLNTFVHTYPNDLAILLVGPSGAKSILMGNVGGSSDPGVLQLTFDQSSPYALNSSDTATSGTYRPSEAAATPDLTAPAPPGPYPVDLNVFNNGPANGTWRLFVEDTASGDSGVIVGGWSLNLTAPVNTVTAGKPKLNKKNGTAQLPVTVGDSGNLALSGKGVATIASAGATKSVAVGGPGTKTLKVKPKGKTKRTLNETGKAKVKVKVTFTPTNGTPNTVTKKIKLKKNV